MIICAPIWRRSMRRLYSRIARGCWSGWRGASCGWGRVCRRGKQDGGHRSVPPENTLKKYAHLVSPITGVVRMLAPVRQDEGIPHVYMAGHNPAMKMDRLDHLKQGLRYASCGKGMSETQAKVSALC